MGSIRVAPVGSSVELVLIGAGSPFGSIPPRLELLRWVRLLPLDRLPPPPKSPARRSQALARNPLSTSRRGDREPGVAEIAGTRVAVRRRARIPQRNALRCMSLPFPGQVSGTAVTAGRACLYEES